MGAQDYSPGQKFFAEFVGTAFLLMAIVGSGIMGENLAGGQAGLALLCNALSVGAALIVLITLFGPVSGAHFNPAVTLLMLIKRDTGLKQTTGYIFVQISGALLGTFLSHLMFDLPAFQISQTARTGSGQWLAEAIATFGLLITILAAVRYRPDQVAFMVGLYIVSAFWFTASTSFANPAVTIGRMFTDTFAGIAPPDAPAFIMAQAVAILAAFAFSRLVFTPARSALR